MINSIIDGISIALNEEFGDAYTIYTESVDQGLKEPCFSILCLNPTSTHVMGRTENIQRYFKQNLFCVHYFPQSSDEKQTECMDVIDRLFECLEYITVDDGGQLRGTEMHGEVTDGVVSFMVNYDGYVYKNVDKFNMDTLSIHQTQKG